MTISALRSWSGASASQLCSERGRIDTKGLECARFCEQALPRHREGEAREGRARDGDQGRFGSVRSARRRSAGRNWPTCSANGSSSPTRACGCDTRIRRRGAASRCRRSNGFRMCARPISSPRRIKRGSRKSSATRSRAMVVGPASSRCARSTAVSRTSSARSSGIWAPTTRCCTTRSSVAMSPSLRFVERAPARERGAIPPHRRLVANGDLFHCRRRVDHLREPAARRDPGRDRRTRRRAFAARMGAPRRLGAHCRIGRAGVCATTRVERRAADPPALRRSAMAARAGRTRRPHRSSRPRVRRVRSSTSPTSARRSASW